MALAESYVRDSGPVDWQEYQEAAAVLFESAEGIGHVRRNVMVPDRITGELRQVDALLEIETKDLTIRVVIDAKFHSHRIDVTHVESVLELARAVGAAQAVIVAANGWTAPAERKAAHENVTLRLLTIDEALDLIVPDKWSLCPGCERDCLVLEHENAMVINGLFAVFLAGRCRACRLAFFWCWDCGEKLAAGVGEARRCTCGHLWLNENEGLAVEQAMTRRRRSLGQPGLPFERLGET